MMRTAPAFFVLLLAACSGAEESRTLTGYVEAETLYMAPQESGVVAEVLVREGDRVAAGDILFRLDPARVALQKDQAEAAAAGVAARVDNAGALARTVEEAEAQYENAGRNAARSRELRQQGVVSVERADNDRALMEAAEARLAGARAERAAAMSDSDAAGAEAAFWRRRLADLDVTAPAGGTIERIYRRGGEVVAAGEPVIALLPPENLKVRFFAPEKLLSSLDVGAEIGVSCDGCAETFRARISYISREPQFTPPVIYSIDEREKLVFLVEARLDGAPSLRPGLPVDVSLP